LHPIHVRAAVGIGKVFHSDIPVRIQLNLICAAEVTGNGIGPCGQVLTVVGIGIPAQHGI